MAVGMALVILGFEYLADDSVINLVYKVASYTYGPILGMFAFGMFTRLRIRDGWMPVVAVAAPVLSALVQYWARGVGLPDRVRTFDLQCRLYHGRHVVACQEE